MGGMGSMTDRQVVEAMQGYEETSGLGKQEFWDLHPLARNMRDGTRPALYVGLPAPDGPVSMIDVDIGSATGASKAKHIMLLDAVRAVQGGVPPPYTLLNFGSYT